MCEASKVAVIFFVVIIVIIIIVVNNNNNNDVSNAWLATAEAVVAFAFKPFPDPPQTALFP